LRSALFAVKPAGHRRAQREGATRR